MYADWLDENAGEVPCDRCGGDGLHTVIVCGKPDNRMKGRRNCAVCSGKGRVPDGRRERAEFIRVQCELAKPLAASCRACGTRLHGDWVADGCPCNSPRGINHGIVPAYVCTCPICDPEESGSARARPADVERLHRREQELWDAHAREWFPLLDRFKMGRTGRGFVESLTCTAADWLQHADALTWHPSQTVERPRCEVCGGKSADERGRWKDKHGHDYWIRCAACKGVDRAPRPVPPTAHPITKVTLTTWPGIERPDGALRDVYRFTGRRGAWTIPPGEHIQTHLFRKEWPGITFALPP
jgi:hypothetical protein